MKVKVNWLVRIAKKASQFDRVKAEKKFLNKTLERRHIVCSRKAEIFNVKKKTRLEFPHILMKEALNLIY